MAIGNEREVWLTAAAGIMKECEQWTPENRRQVLLMQENDAQRRPGAAYKNGDLGIDIQYCGTGPGTVIGCLGPLRMVSSVAAVCWAVSEGAVGIGPGMCMPWTPGKGWAPA